MNPNNQSQGKPKPSCHPRGLCGYGGGLWRKKWLLDHERRYTRGQVTGDQ